MKESLLAVIHKINVQCDETAYAGPTSTSFAHGPLCSFFFAGFNGYRGEMYLFWRLKGHRPRRDTSLYWASGSEVKHWWEFGDTVQWFLAEIWLKRWFTYYPIWTSVPNWKRRNGRNWLGRYYRPETLEFKFSHQIGKLDLVARWNSKVGAKWGPLMNSLSVGVVAFCPQTVNTFKKTCSCICRQVSILSIDGITILTISHSG